MTGPEFYHVRSLHRKKGTAQTRYHQNNKQLLSLKKKKFESQLTIREAFDLRYKEQIPLQNESPLIQKCLFYGDAVCTFQQVCSEVLH